MTAIKADLIASRCANSSGHVYFREDTIFHERKRKLAPNTQSARVLQENVIRQLEEQRENLTIRLEKMEEDLESYKTRKERSKKTLETRKRNIEKLRTKIGKISDRIQNEKEKKTTVIYQRRQKTKPTNIKTKLPVIEVNTREKNLVDSYNIVNEMGIKTRRFSNKPDQSDKGDVETEKSLRFRKVVNDVIKTKYNNGDNALKLPPIKDGQNPSRGGKAVDNLSLAWLLNKKFRKAPSIGIEKVRNSLERSKQTTLPVEVYVGVIKQAKKLAGTMYANKFFPPIAVQKDYWDNEELNPPPMIKEDERKRIKYIPNKRRVSINREDVVLRQNRFVRKHSVVERKPCTYSDDELNQSHTYLKIDKLRERREAEDFKPPRRWPSASLKESAVLIEHDVYLKSRTNDQ